MGSMVKAIFYLLVIVTVNCVIIKDNVESSAYCKLECIQGKSNNFCLSNQKTTEGTCCTRPGCGRKLDYCSDAVGQKLDAMKFHACPKENWCGPYKINPKADGSVTEVRPTGDYEKKFTKGSLCTYQVNFPQKAERGDQLEVTLGRIRMIKPTFIASEAFAAKKYKVADMYDGAVVSIGNPFKVYLTMESTAESEADISDFTFSVKYLKYQEVQNKTREEVAAETDVLVIKNSTLITKIIQKNLWESNEFVTIVIVAFVALLLIIGLICCLVYLRIKADKINKVEKLKGVGVVSASGYGGRHSPGHSTELGGLGGNGPSSKPNFDDDGDNQIMGAQSNMFKNQSEQEQFMEFFRKLQEKEKQKGSGNKVASINGSVRTNAPPGMGQRGEQESMAIEELDEFPSYMPNQMSHSRTRAPIDQSDDPMMPMGGNSIIAAAREDAARAGYVKQTNYEAGYSSGLGGLPSLAAGRPNKKQVGALPPI